MKLCASPNARTQARRLADHIAADLRAAAAARGAASLAVSGGDTPGLLFDALARRDAAWGGVTVTLVDERWLAARDPGSNERLVRARLLRGRARAARFIPLKNFHANPGAGLALATARLRPALPLDVCVLGMGEDGHIASLFPGQRLGARRSLIAVEAPGARAAAARMSLSFREILAARAIVVLIRGAAKLTALRRHLAQGGATPIGALAARRRSRVWISWAP